jgi:hypothetical protein
MEKQLFGNPSLLSTNNKRDMTPDTPGTGRPEKQFTGTGMALDSRPSPAVPSFAGTGRIEMQMTGTDVSLDKTPRHGYDDSMPMSIRAKEQSRK